MRKKPKMSKDALATNNQIYFLLGINQLGKHVLKGAKKRGFDLGKSILSPKAPRELALIHSEVTEALEEMRKPKPQILWFGKDGKPEGVGPELADVVMRVAECASAWGIDLNRMIRIKDNYNEGRKFKHGGKRF